uniref:Uncharacterized protein n=1 Tax=Heterorhabditis bacteriophora TaxID=37862 RepID=A0A1I7WWJ6_HETBA
MYGGSIGCGPSSISGFNSTTLERAQKCVVTDQKMHKYIRPTRL